jgi:glycosyltransferase involved in cell wall biosynthesis
MRVLYFTERDTPHDRRFLAALAGTDHQVFALRRFAGQPQTPEGVTELTWPLGRPDWSDWAGWQAGVSQFAQILAETRPDVVHAGPVQGPALVTALAGFHPLVTMSWGSDLLRTAPRSPWMRQATRCALDQTDVFLGDCQTVADAAAGFGFPRERMVLFPWGVDLAHFSPENGREAGRALRSALGWADQFVILCNRTWAPLYGVDDLARAFAEAVRVTPRLRLLLVGDGPQAGLIHAILDPLGDKVHFAGRVTQADLPAFYQAADLYVSPSHSDGSSISLLEALACGRPVLVSDIPSNREWVEVGVNGRTFRDGSVADLAESLVAMAYAPEVPHYGIAGRSVAEARANWPENFKQCLAAYRMAVEFSNTPTPPDQDSGE